MFEQELEFFIAHQDELVARYKGKALVIRGNDLIGAYDTPLKAYLAAKTEFPAGTFMIQPCEPGQDAYTVTVNSAVADSTPTRG